jgi:carbon storage regulator CsrA
MLCLNRRTQESIYVTAPDGTLIIITMLGWKRNAANLGIRAPKEWAIDREEIWRRKQGEATGNVA